jgi:hypothetical protein
MAETAMIAVFIQSSSILPLKQTYRNPRRSMNGCSSLGQCHAMLKARRITLQMPA